MPSVFYMVTFAMEIARINMDIIAPKMLFLIDFFLNSSCLRALVKIIMLNISAITAIDAPM